MELDYVSKLRIRIVDICHPLTPSPHAHRLPVLYDLSHGRTDIFIARDDNIGALRLPISITMFFASRVWGDIGVVLATSLVNGISDERSIYAFLLPVIIALGDTRVNTSS